jgi:hypothetical protein|tara:strand:- start:5197 stop:5376 length:180 start_codon:yes stop_codon:yes gene_type:complete
MKDIYIIFSLIISVLIGGSIFFSNKNQKNISSNSEVIKMQDIHMSNEAKKITGGIPHWS